MRFLFSLICLASLQAICFSQLQVQVAQPVSLTNKSNDPFHFKSGKPQVAEDGSYLFPYLVQINVDQIDLDKFDQPYTHKSKTNRLYLQKLNSALTIESSTELFFDKTYQKRVIESNKNQTVVHSHAVDSLMNQYPNVFVQKPEVVYHIPTGTPCIYTPYLLDYDYSAVKVLDYGNDIHLQESIKRLTSKSAELPASVNTKKLFYFRNALIDSENGYVTSYFGIMNSDDKWNTHKQLLFATSNANEAFVDSFSVVFTCARELESQYLVYSANGKEIVGKVFVFKAVSRKRDDPAETKYELVYLNKTGKLIFQKKLTIDDEIKSNFHAYYAYATPSELVVIGNLESKTASGVCKFNITNDAVSFSVVANLEALANKLVITSQPIPFEQYKRSSMGLGGNKLGLNGFNQDMNVEGHCVLADNSLLIYGRLTTEIMESKNEGPSARQSINNSNMGPTASPSTTRKEVFGEWIGLHINAAGELISQYVVRLPLSEEYKASLVQTTDQGFWVSVPVPCRESNLVDKSFRMWESPVNENLKCQWNEKFELTPVVASANTAQRSLKSYVCIDPEFSLIEPKNYGLYDAKSNTFIFYGFKRTKQGSALQFQRVQL